MTTAQIRVPLLNANEPEARLAAVHVTAGQFVDKGMALFTIETTKAAADIEAPQEGFIHPFVKEGQILYVGQLLAVLTTTPDEKVDVEKEPASGDASSTLRITKPARRLAEQLGLNLLRLPDDRLITEALVRQVYGQESAAVIQLPASEKQYLLIYGAGGHAKSVMEIVLQCEQYAIAGIVDDNASLTGSNVLGIPVLGTKVLLPALLQQGVSMAANSVGGILDIGIRVRVFEGLEREGYGFPTLIHPSATVETSARLGLGSQIFANAYIGSEALLHERTIINTNAVISHDCEIGAYAHIAPGALLAGHVHVGERCLVGMGVTTAIGLHIGSGARIGNAAVLLADVPDRAIVQAGSTWMGTK